MRGAGFYPFWLNARNRAGIHFAGFDLFGGHNPLGAHFVQPGAWENKNFNERAPRYS